MQLPQLVTDRVAPQLSDPETVAQFLPSRAQKAASVSATQGTGPPLVPQPDAKRAATAAAAARKARRRFVVLDDARNEQRLSISVRLSSIMVRGIVESRDEPVNISMSGRIEHTECRAMVRRMKPYVICEMTDSMRLLDAHMGT